MATGFFEEVVVCGCYGLEAFVAGGSGQMCGAWGVGIWMMDLYEVEIFEKGQSACRGADEKLTSLFNFLRGGAFFQMKYLMRTWIW